MSEKKTHQTHFQVGEMPWKKEKDMKYLRRLSNSVTDNRNVFVEFLLAWIAICLTALVIFAILSSCGA